MSYMLGKSVTITDNYKVEERDTPIMDVTHLSDHCYKITDANFESINLEMDKLYPQRLIEYYKESKGFKKVEMSRINFEALFNNVVEEFGYGEYTINAITHQPFLFDEVDSSGFGDNLLIRTEVSCKITLKENDFDIMDIDYVEPYVFATDIPAVIDMAQWKKMTNMMDSEEQQQFVEETAKQMEEKLSELYMNKNMVTLAHVWDKVNVTRQRQYN